VAFRGNVKEAPTVPVAKEFTVLVEDGPGMLGKVCRALADGGVNILALQSFPIGGKSVIRFIVDNPTTAKTVLVSEGLTLASRTSKGRPQFLSKLQPRL
jgi:hypothetical protein